MKYFLKYIGIAIQILGVAILAFPFFGGFESNESLTIGLFMILGGFVIHVLIRRGSI
ncbi:MAG: hypothetical protein LBU57_00900 [Dysgonamonadaceae bacterium]|nr:hypothetical protein [Dysgonamonadaceae bacterium]